MQNIRGIVTEIKNQNQEKNSSLVLVDYEVDGVLRSTKAFLKGLSYKVGDVLFVEGDWRQNTWNGRAEKVFGGWRSRSDLPRTRAGAERFLNLVFQQDKESLAEHGITEQAISRLLDRHGPEILTQAVDHPKVLTGISKFADSPKHVRQILELWNGRTTGPRAVSLLQSSGLGEPIIDRILGAWGRSTLENLNRNPYGAIAIPRVDFDHLDMVGKHMGISDEDERRLTAAVINVLRQRASDGSTAVDINTLLLGLTDVSGVDQEVLYEFLTRAAQSQNPDFKIVASTSGPVAALTELYEAEATITHRLAELCSAGRRNDPLRVEQAGNRLFKQPSFAKLDAVQQLAVIMASTEPVCILTGGPGTGKSTVMDAVSKLCSEMDGGVLFLAAPTGKASKRLEETTGRKASTLHRLLGARGADSSGIARFDRDNKNPLPPRSTVVIDEASMVDVFLMAAVLKALPKDGRIIIVGDDGQLPSVGPGSVLADLLSSRVEGKPVIPSVKLEKVYRQSSDSAIAKGAALIRKGKIPKLTAKDQGGVSFQDMDPRVIVDEVERLVCKTLPQAGYDPLKDIAVLCPQAKGRAGTWEINTRLSSCLNQSGKSIVGVARAKEDDPEMPIPRIGDRVMLTENDADQDVMNGDTGVITGTVDRKGKTMIAVKFDSGVEGLFPVSHWRSLILAYAGTIHKSQGSQYKAVLMPMSMGHAKMLDRTLIYTGWTRAQNKLVLLGEETAVEHAITNLRGSQRMALLNRFLSGLNSDILKKSAAMNWLEKLARAINLLPPEPKEQTQSPGNAKKPEGSSVIQKVFSRIAQASKSTFDVGFVKQPETPTVPLLRPFASPSIYNNTNLSDLGFLPEEPEEIAIPSLRPFPSSSFTASDITWLSSLFPSNNEPNSNWEDDFDWEALEDDLSYQHQNDGDSESEVSSFTP